jgi:hypothetical protein
MPVFKVLTNAKGDVLGTARVDIGASGPGAPQQATLVARPGQRLVEVNVDDKLARLDAAALHAAIKSTHIRPKSKTGSPKAKGKSRKA